MTATARDNDLIGNTDAQVWAERFVERAGQSPFIATDEGTMVGWFACAIEAGRDAAAERADDQTVPEQWYLDATAEVLALRGALRVIAGPADEYDPFMDAYREADGGYEGLQAIARAALNSVPMTNTEAPGA